jgi:hypothetical protein
MRMLVYDQGKVLGGSLDEVGILEMKPNDFLRRLLTGSSGVDYGVNVHTAWIYGVIRMNTVLEW